MCVKPVDSHSQNEKLKMIGMKDVMGRLLRKDGTERGRNIRNGISIKINDEEIFDYYF
jgi:hypothetical protein